MTAPDTDLRQAALADPLRPAFHFTSPAGWLNDPNGVAQRDGVFHLFYQYNPLTAEHNRIRWGHAISTDLVRWHDRPIALSPSDGGPDADGCWSGVLVDDDGTPTIVYSGNSAATPTQTACVARSDTSLDRWQKEPGNPVIASPSERYSVTGFRDHCVWRETGAWRQLIGSGLHGRGGCAFLYESDDLIHWRELGPLIIGDASALPEDDDAWSGTMWECVDFFRFTPDGTSAPPDARTHDPHLLIFSAWHEDVTRHSLIVRGTYHDDRFDAHAYQRLDLGGRHAYAPQTFADESGRRVLWSWMQEARPAQAQHAAGWSGAMAIPRRLWLDDTLTVRQEPVAEFAMLREAPLAFEPRGAGFAASSVQAEAELSVDVPDDGAVRIDVFATGDEAEQTVITLRRSPSTIEVSVDRSRASLDDTVDASPHRGEVPGAGATIDVRILLDRSSLEVFVDGIALTTRVYPTRADATGFRVEPIHGATVRDVKGWHLARAEARDRTLEPGADQSVVRDTLLVDAMLCRVVRANSDCARSGVLGGAIPSTRRATGQLRED